MSNYTLYDLASLVLTPNAYKTSRIYSSVPNNGTGDFTFSRTSSGLRRNASGVWESVATNMPRLSYPTGSTCPRWLFEPQRVNQNANCRSYTITSGTITAGQPDMFGGNNATLVVANAGGIFRSTDQPAHVVSTQYASGILLKVQSGSVTFNLALNATNISSANGNIILSPTSAVASGAAAAIDMGDGWFWCYLVYTALVTDGGRVNFTTASASTYLADVAQREVSSFLTSPIITSGTTVTREQDNFLTFTSDAINCGTQGTIFFEIAYTRGANAAASFRFGTSTTALQLAFYEETTGLGIYDYLNSRWLVDPINAPNGGKYVITWNGSTSKTFFNGVLQNSYTSGTAFNINQITNQSATFGSFLIKGFFAFKTVLTDSNCIALTT